MAAKGELDIGKIYQVFARKDLGVSGIIRADAPLRENKVMPVAGKYELLKNTGTMEVKNIRITHQNFPKPFLYPAGSFSF